MTMRLVPLTVLAATSVILVLNARHWLAQRPNLLFCTHAVRVVARTTTRAGPARPLFDTAAALTGTGGRHADSFPRFCWTLGGLSLFGIVLALIVRFCVGGPELDTPPRTSRRHFPSRIHYFVFALCFTSLAVYGSLVPLRFTSIPLFEAIDRFSNIPFLNLRVQHRADWVANILLFVPMGFLWLAVLLVDQPSRRRALLSAPLVVIACTLLSISIEFTQLWFPPRTVAQNDILAETIGGIAGVILWLALGRIFTNWVRAYGHLTRSQARFDWLLQAYMAGLLIYSLLPMDLTLSPVDLVRKYRQGKIELLPFSTGVWGFQPLYSLITSVLVWLPVGMLAAVCCTNSEKTVRSRTRSFVFGTTLVLITELAQLVVYSRYTSMTDLIAGAAGVAAGVWLIHRWHASATTEIASSIRRSFKTKSWPWLVVSCVYSVIVILVFCMPIRIVYDARIIREEFLDLWQPPFSDLYYGTEFNAMTDVLRNVLFFVPLGAFLAKSVVNADLGRTSRKTLLLISIVAAAGLSLAIELFQLFLPLHVPDLTDLLLCTLGAGLGVVLVTQLGVDREPGKWQLSLAEGTRQSSALAVVHVQAKPSVFLRIAFSLVLAAVLLAAVAIGIPFFLSA